VIVTAFSDPSVERRASEWGAPVVTKPFSMATLKAAIAEALRGKAS
jgi:DNA-binding response OmpR family regulator